LGVFALYGGDTTRLNAGWVWPAVLAFVGLVLMALTTRSTMVSRRKDPVADDAPAFPPATDD